MKTINKSLLRLFLAVVILFINLGSMPGIVDAAPGDGVIDITVEYGIDCGEVTFDISLDDLTVPYQYHLEIDYGDGGPIESKDLNSAEVTLIHTYSSHGDYNLTITVTETGAGSLTGTTSSVITIADPPVVTLSSDPFPPLVGPGDTVEFTATVIGGVPPYSYAWDAPLVVGDITKPWKASSTFTAAGKYQAQVTVTDFNGCIVTDTLPVVVSDPGDICHPTAQKIADAVNTIFPAQAGDLYACEEIYDIFDGVLTGDQVGFGRMWKAYNLALTMEDLTWEEIRDWHLDTGGWGALLQLDRFSELLETHSLPDLMGLVMSEDYSLGDVRTAVRSTTHYEADFDDALARIAAGATAGELGQFYKLAADLELDPAALDVYLAGEFTLSQLKHTAKVADRMEVDWTEIADAGGFQDYMKDLREADKEERTEQQAAQQVDKNQQTADKLAEQYPDYTGDVMSLFNGECKEDWACVRETLRKQEKTQAEQQAAQQDDKNQQTANKLSEQYPDYPGDVMSLLNGECEGDWACVRETLRKQEKTQAEGLSEKDLQTALQIFSKYGYPQEEVLEYHNTSCGGDWACTRAYFRELSASTKETGKPDK